jgi:signal transduction histidine kinase
LSATNRGKVVVILLAALSAVIVLVAPSLPTAPWQVLLFLCIAVVFLQRFVIPQRVGHLSLVLLAMQASAILLSTFQAFLLGALVAFLNFTRRDTRNNIANSAIRPAFGAAIGAWLVSSHLLPRPLVAVLVILAVSAHNILGTGLGLAFLNEMSIADVFRRVFSRSFAMAFLYFGLASFLLANVLDGSIMGFISGAIVVVLSVAVAETLGERRVREALEVERVEHQRHAATARVVEGLLHNLRNRVALLRFALEELEVARNATARREAVDRIRQAVEEAAGSIADVEDGLRTSSGAHRLPTDLGELVGSVAASYQAMARAKGIRLKADIRTERLTAAVDAPMVRDVVGNLIKNAIEASPGHGEVEVVVARGKGRVVITVADDGPGIPEELKDRLFEPHFTTKSQGTGLGLFTSFGIVREHRGRLYFRPGPKGGAVFTVELPFGKEQLEPEPRRFGAVGFQDPSVSV